MFRTGIMRMNVRNLWTPGTGGGPGTAAGKDVQDSGDGGAPRQYYVFVIPIDSELSLKKAARAVGVKSLSMIPVKDITAVTGYVRGGCTALGMKKKYPTVIDSGAEALPEIVVSGGGAWDARSNLPRGFAPGGGCFLCGCSGTGRPPVRVLFRKCGYSR